MPLLNFKHSLLDAKRLCLTHKYLCGQSLEGARKPPCNNRGWKTNVQDKDLTLTLLISPLRCLRLQWLRCLGLQWMPVTPCIVPFKWMDIFKKKSTIPMSKCDTIWPLNSTTLLMTFRNNKIKSRKTSRVKSNWICQNVSERTQYIANLSWKHVSKQDKVGGHGGNARKTEAKRSLWQCGVQERYVFGFVVALKSFNLV